VAAFARDPQSSALTQLPGTKGCLTRGGKNGCARYNGATQAFSLAVSPDGASVYRSEAHNAGANALLAFTRSPADGSLRQLQRRAGCYLDRASTARREGCTAVRVAGRGRSRGQRQRPAGLRHRRRGKRVRPAHLRHAQPDGVAGSRGHSELVRVATAEQERSRRRSADYRCAREAHALSADDVGLAR
jgi:hypothetical protein